MADLKVEIISTIALILVTILFISITNRAIKRFGKLVSIDVNKRKIIFYLSHLVIYFIGLTILSLIWGGKPKGFCSLHILNFSHSRNRFCSPMVYLI